MNFPAGLRMEKAQPSGMESLTRQQKLFGKLGRPSRFNKPQKQPLIPPVEFVADHGKTRRQKMCSNLMQPSGLRKAANQRKGSV
jgi:hypothetical protein